MNRLGRLFLGLIILLGIAAGAILVNYNAFVNALPPVVQMRMPELGNAPEALPTAAVDTTDMGLLDSIEISTLPTVEDEADESATETVEPTPPRTRRPRRPTHTPDISEPITAITEQQEPDTPTPEPTDTPTPEPTETDTPTPTKTSTPTATPIPLPETHRIEGLINIPQTFNNCGPANLSINLAYHGDETTQQAVANYLKPNPNDRNVSPWQINDYVNEQTTLSSTVHSGGTLSLLKQLIASDFSVVIERGIDFEDGNGWYGHYLTVFGYDDEAELFQAMDTFAKPWSPQGNDFSYEEIETSWHQFNNTFYVVFPAEKQADISAIIGEELLDEQKMWERTLTLAQEQVEDDEDDKWAWFNLGTSYTELGKMTGSELFYERGAAAFDKARTFELPYRMLWYQFRPYMAYLKVGRVDDVITLADTTLTTRGGLTVEETYLWKGHALTTKGDIAGAEEAYSQAIKLNENFYPAQIALESIGGTFIADTPVPTAIPVTDTPNWASPTPNWASPTPDWNSNS